MPKVKLSWGRHADAKRVPCPQVSERDRRCLLAFVLGKSLAAVQLEEELTREQYAQFVAMLQRVEHSEPVAYVIGEWDFYGLTLKLNSQVLIPRPETEELVDTVLDAAVVPQAPAHTVIDMGTGSGAIALALASQRPHWSVLAMDKMPQALVVAKANARRLGLAEQMVWRCADWSTCSGSEYVADIVVANPPYIDVDDPDVAPAVRKYEPASALFAEQRGLADLAAVIKLSAQCLRYPGWLFLEHGSKQAIDVQKLLQQHGFIKIVTLRDMSGHQRITYASRSPKSL